MEATAEAEVVFPFLISRFLSRFIRRLSAFLRLIRPNLQLTRQQMLLPLSDSVLKKRCILGWSIFDKIARFS